MDEKDNGYLDVLYSTCVQEIMSFKSQQWHATNYALLPVSYTHLTLPTICSV